ncbi:hypothetical protein ABQ333_04980 [Serratia fonticola]|uniref:hypothetical protein n=1 Tax=Serratia fonticola TaxID=47917 RepID=UPI003AAFFFAE
MKISKKSSIIAIVFLCIGFASYPLVGIIKDKINENDALVLSGNMASFFSEYLVPIAKNAGGSKLDYSLFYGYEDGKKIEISAKSIKLSHDDFQSIENKREIPELTKIELTEIYCKYSGVEPVLPATADAGFIKARRENKSIAISYYDRTGQTLFFAIGVSPSSCDK